MQRTKEIVMTFVYLAWGVVFGATVVASVMAQKLRTHLRDVAVRLPPMNE